MGLYKRGKVWWTSETVNGIRYRKSTAKTDRDEAKVRAAEILAERGGEPKAPPKRRRALSNPPMFAAIESYVRHRKDSGRKESSYRLLQGPLCEALGNDLVRSVTSERISAMLRGLATERSWGSATRATAINELSGLFTYALLRGWITEHPIRGGRVAKPDVDNARERWLLPAEIDAIKKHSPEWLRDVIDFAVKTCRRLGEITALTRKRIILDVHGRPFLVTERTKNGRRVRVQLCGELAGLVKRKVIEAESDDAPLFPGPNGGNARMSIRRYFKKAVEEAGLPYGRGQDEISFHTLRHSGASILANAGVRLEAIMTIGNWRDRRMVERYMHLGDDLIADAMERLDGIVSGTCSRPARRFDTIGATHSAVN